MSRESVINLFSSLRDTVAESDFVEYQPVVWHNPQSNTTAPLLSPTHPLNTLSALPYGPFDPQLLKIFSSSSSFVRLTEIYLAITALPAHDLLAFFLQNSDSLSLFKQLFLSHEVKSVRYHAWFFLSPVLLSLWHAVHALDVEGVAAGGPTVALESQRDVQQRREELCETVSEIFVYASRVVTGELTVSRYAVPVSTTQPAVTTQAKDAAKPSQLIEDNLYTVNLFLSPLVALLQCYTHAHTHWETFCDALCGNYGSLTERQQVHEREATHHYLTSLAPLAQSVLDVLLSEPSLLLSRCAHSLSSHNLYLSLWTQCLFLFSHKIQQHKRAFSHALGPTEKTLLGLDLSQLSLTLAAKEKPLFLDDAEKSQDLTEKSRNAEFPLNISQYVCEWVMSVLRVRVCGSESVAEREFFLRDLLVFTQYEIMAAHREQLSEDILTQALFLCEHYTELSPSLSHTHAELLCWALIALRSVSHSSVSQATRVFVRVLAQLKAVGVETVTERERLSHAALARLLADWAATLCDASLSLPTERETVCERVCESEREEQEEETLLQSVVRDALLPQRELLTVSRTNSFSSLVLHSLSLAVSAVQHTLREILEGRDCGLHGKAEDKEGIPSELMTLSQRALTTLSEDDEKSERECDEALREALQCVWSQTTTACGESVCVSRVSLSQDWVVERESVRCVSRFRYLSEARSVSSCETLAARCVSELCEKKRERLLARERVERVWREDCLSLLGVVCVLYEERLALANVFARCLSWRDNALAPVTVLGTFQSLLDDLLKPPSQQYHSQTTPSHVIDTLSLLRETTSLPTSCLPSWLCACIETVRQRATLSLFSLFETFTAQASSDLLMNPNIRGLVVLVVKYLAPYLLSCCVDGNNEERSVVCARYEELLVAQAQAVLGYVRARLSLSVEERLQRESLRARAAVGLLGDAHNALSQHTDTTTTTSSAEREREFAQCLSLSLSLFELLCGRVYNNHDKPSIDSIIVPNLVLQRVLSAYSTLCGELERETLLCEAEECLTLSVLSPTQRCLTMSRAARLSLHTLLRAVRLTTRAHNARVAAYSSAAVPLSPLSLSHTQDLLSDDTLTHTATTQHSLTNVEGLSHIALTQHDLSAVVQHVLSQTHNTVTTQRAHTTAAEAERVCERLSALLCVWDEVVPHNAVTQQADSSLTALSHNDDLLSLSETETERETETRPHNALSQPAHTTHTLSPSLTHRERQRERALRDELFLSLSLSPARACVLSLCDALAHDVLYDRLTDHTAHHTAHHTALCGTTQPAVVDIHTTLSHNTPSLLGEWAALLGDYQEHAYTELSAPNDVLKIQGVVSARCVGASVRSAGVPRVSLTLRVRAFNACVSRLSGVTLSVLSHTTLAHNAVCGVSVCESESVSVESLSPSAFAERDFTFSLSLPLSETERHTERDRDDALRRALSLSFSVRAVYRDLLLGSGDEETTPTLKSIYDQTTPSQSFASLATVGKAVQYPVYLTGGLTRLAASAVQRGVCCTDSAPLVAPLSLFLLPFSRGAVSALCAWREIESEGCVGMREVCESVCDCVCEGVCEGESAFCTRAVCGAVRRPLMPWEVLCAQHARLAHSHPQRVLSVRVQSTLCERAVRGDTSSVSPLWRRLLRCVEFVSATQGGVGAFSLSRDALSWDESEDDIEREGCVGWALQTLWQHEVSVMFLSHSHRQSAAVCEKSETEREEQGVVCGVLVMRSESEEVLDAIERDVDRVVEALSGGFFCVADEYEEDED